MLTHLYLKGDLQRLEVKGRWSVHRHTSRDGRRRCPRYGMAEYYRRCEILLIVRRGCLY